MIYFDNSSTTSVSPEVLHVYTQLLKDLYGNPDSLHGVGRKAGQLMEKSRAAIAGMLRVRPDEILFTGSASESNTLAIVGYALANQSRGKHILISNVEHASVAHSADFLQMFGFEVDTLPINEQGIVTPEIVKKHMRKDTILVSCMHVNNEMGAINPIEEIEKVVHNHPTCKFHVDCVQSFSKIDIPVSSLDMMTVSAHKIHGLKGSALLMKKRNIRLLPIVQGGQQEQGLRGGTQNAPVNIVLAKTIRLALEQQEASYKKVSRINQWLREQLRQIPGAHIHSPENALPYILNIGFDSLTSVVLLNALDERGICVSAKSTCSSHGTNESEVLKAMGKTQKEATHMIRLSFSKENTMKQAETFIQVCKEIIDQYGLSL
ncbi:MAG: cysteine desulfurase [Erysipelotrichaceae bacterium]|nr:cysteine desulfurase [Erysipelotrichaceae bacterium]